MSKIHRIGLSAVLLGLRQDVIDGRAPVVVPTGDAALARASIAVLPFRLLGAQPDTE